MATNVTELSSLSLVEAREKPSLIQRILWWGFGATLISLAFSPYRLSFSFLGGSAPFNLPIPNAIMLVAVFLGWIQSTRRRAERVRVVRPPYGIFYALLLYFFFSAFFAPDEILGLRDASKLLGGIFITIAIATHFPDDERLLGQVWTLVVWCSAVVFGALIYQYAVVFQAPYLGANFETMTRELRNQLLWYLIFILPFALTHALENGRLRLLQLAPLLVLIVAWFYGSSRNTWISVAVGLIAVSPLAFRGRGKRALFLAVVSFTAIMTVAWVGWASISDSVGEVEAGKRFQYLYDPASVPEYDSYGFRTQLAEDSLTIWLRSPVFGVGLSSTGLTHSDYPALLAETGILGFSLFVIMIGLLFRDLFPMPRGLPADISWMSIASRAVLVGAFLSLAAINGYNSPIVWTFLGLAYKLARIERLRAPSEFSIQP